MHGIVTCRKASAASAIIVAGVLPSTNSKCPTLRITPTFQLVTCHTQLHLPSRHHHPPPPPQHQHSASWRQPWRPLALQLHRFLFPVATNTRGIVPTLQGVLLKRQRSVSPNGPQSVLPSPCFTACRLQPSPNSVLLLLSPPVQSTQPTPSKPAPLEPIMSPTSATRRHRSSQLAVWSPLLSVRTHRITRVNTIQHYRFFNGILTTTPNPRTLLPPGTLRQAPTQRVQRTHAAQVVVQVVVQTFL